MLIFQHNLPSFFSHFNFFLIILSTSFVRPCVYINQLAFAQLTVFADMLNDLKAVKKKHIKKVE